MDWLCLEAFVHAQTTGKRVRETGPAAKTAPCELPHTPLQRSAGSHTPSPSHGATNLRQPQNNEHNRFIILATTWEGRSIKMYCCSESVRVKWFPTSRASQACLVRFLRCQRYRRTQSDISIGPYSYIMLHKFMTFFLSIRNL